MMVVMASFSTASCYSVSHAGFCASSLLSSPSREPLRFEGKRSLLGNINCWIWCNDKHAVGEESGGCETKSTRQRSQKQEIKRQALASYRARFTKALQAELNEEMRGMKERLSRWSRQQLEAEGFALFNLSVGLEGKIFRNKVLRFYICYGDGFLPPQNQFNQGDVVLISRSNPVDEGETVVEGIVMERARRYLRVVISASQANLIRVHTRWRLDLSANRVAYDRCLFAIEAFSSCSINQKGVLSGQSKVSKTSSCSNGPIAFGEAALAVRRILMAIELVEEERLKFQLLSSQLKDESGAEIISADSYKVLEGVKTAGNPPSHVSGKHFGMFKGGIRAFLRERQDELNASQRSAIEAAACQKVTLWQGPPGTGKTKTLVHLILALCRSKHGKIIACADSNVAVDNLVEGLLHLGLQVARVGQPVKVKEELRGCTIEALVATHPLMKRATQMKLTAVAQRQNVRQTNSKKKRSICAKETTNVWDDAIQLEARAIKDVLDRVDVVATTCIGAADIVLEGQSFHVCVIDEATQATEPASLVPIIMSGANSIVLVGDPAQLPPTVLSREALEAGLAVSLFEHLQGCGLKPHLLNTQYRMHPAIASIPSVLFYSGLLNSHPLPSERAPPKGFNWPREDNPLVFIDCAGKEECTSEGNSWFNHVEALQVLKVVELLVSGHDVQGGFGGVGVIAPYRAQVRLLEDIFFPGYNEQQERFAGLEVKTVDGFQGLEKEAIVLCTVRSNEEGRLGFVADPRRMNVALTRAKRGLVVIGNSKTLEFDKSWATWLEEMRKRNLYLERIYQPAL